MASATENGLAGLTLRDVAAGPVLRLDAVDFCRVLAGRPGTLGIHDLMSTEVPY